MSNVLVERTTLDSLAESIALKSEENVPMTLSEMIEAVDGITLPQGEINITTNGIVNVAQYESANVNVQGGEPTLQTKSVSYTPTESQQTATVTADSGYDGLDEVDVTVGAISPTYVGSGITRRNTYDLRVSGAFITTPPGYYEDYAEAQVAMGTAGTPTATKGTVSNHSVSVTPSVTNTAGYIFSGNKTGTAVTVTASELASGNKSITQNGTGIDVVGYSTVSVNVPSGSPTLQTKSVSYTPTESQQTATVTADSGYDGLDEVDVTVGAIPSDYVGSGITRRSSTDLIASGATVTAPAGYYANAATKTVASGTEGTPTATKGTVSNHAISVTPSVTNSAGYIAGGTKTGTAVSVSASELVSGTYNVTSSGTKDVTNYSSASVPAGTVTAPSTISGTSATVSTGTNTLTLTKTVSVTPSVSTAGYVSSGTAGNSSVSLTASVTTKAAATYNTSTTDQTISASQYLTGAQTIKAVVVSGLSADKILSGTTVTVGDANDADRIASVSGSVVINRYYTGTSTPSSSTGSNGDIYLKVVS